MEKFIEEILIAYKIIFNEDAKIKTIDSGLLINKDFFISEQEGTYFLEKINVLHGGYWDPDIEDYEVIKEGTFDEVFSFLIEETFTIKKAILSDELANRYFEQIFNSK